MKKKTLCVMVLFLLSAGCYPCYRTAMVIKKPEPKVDAIYQQSSANLDAWQETIIANERYEPNPTELDLDEMGIDAYFKYPGGENHETCFN